MPPQRIAPVTEPFSIWNMSEYADAGVCAQHPVGLSAAFNSVNCCFSVSRTVNELFPLCLNYSYSSRTAPSVILMFTMCLFMDVFSAANCSSTLGTDAAASVELK